MLGIALDEHAKRSDRRSEFNRSNSRSARALPVCEQYAEQQCVSVCGREQRDADNCARIAVCIGGLQPGRRRRFIGRVLLRNCRIPSTWLLHRNERRTNSPGWLAVCCAGLPSFAHPGPERAFRLWSSHICRSRRFCTRRDDRESNSGDRLAICRRGGHSFCHHNHRTLSDKAVRRHAGTRAEALGAGFSNDTGTPPSSAGRIVGPLEADRLPVTRRHALPAGQWQGHGLPGEFCDHLCSYMRQSPTSP